MHLSHHVESFLAWYKTERRPSVRTVQQYQANLRRFVRWLEPLATPEPTLAHWNNALFQQYLTHLRQNHPRKTGVKGLLSSSLHGHFQALRTMEAWLIQEVKLLEESQLKHVKLPPRNKPRRETVSEDEVQTLYRHLPHHPDPQTVARDRALLSILCYAALRRQEILDLTLDDLRFAEQQKKSCLFVRRGKGDKDRFIPMHPTIQDALLAWLALRPRAAHTWLFARNASFRIGEVGIARAIEGMRARAGLHAHENIKPHSLRHYCATRWHRQGVPLRTIQELLGHSDLTTTIRYLHTGQEDMEEITRLPAIEEIIAPRLERPQRENAPPQVGSVKARFLIERRGR